MTDSRAADGGPSPAPAAGQAGVNFADSGHRRARRRLPRRVLFGAGAAVLAGVLGLALAVRSGAAPACAALAAPPASGTTHQGKATFYNLKSGGGNCSYVSAPADRLYVALGPDEYADAAACGGYLDVTGPKGKVRVLITDLCPECPTGHIDLSEEAFTEIADPVRGIVPVSYRMVVDPPLSGPLRFRIKDGASQNWFALLVIGHGNPLRSVEARRSGGPWRAARQEDYNYWIIDSGVGPGSYQIRVTDVRDHRVVVGGIRMAPEELQRGSVRMYGDAGAAPAPERDSAARGPERVGDAPRPKAVSPTPEMDQSPAPAGTPVEPSATPIEEPVEVVADPGQDGAPAGCG